MMVYGSRMADMQDATKATPLDVPSAPESEHGKDL